MKKGRSGEDDVNWILGLEEKYPVERWTIEGVEVWPLIRMRLNFATLTPEQPATTTSPVVQPVVRGPSILKQALSLIRFLVTPPGKTKTITSGFSAHRVNWKNSFFNRYFDPILDYLEECKLDKGLIVEYEFTGDNENYYRPDRVLKLYEFRALLQRLSLYTAKLTSRNYQLERFDEFLKDLTDYKIDTRYHQKESLRKTIYVILGLKWFWKRVFRKTGAKTAIGLCYYSEPLYAMNIAAREEGVTSVDLQHGGLGKLHLAYAHFRKVPAAGVWQLLPRYFWCWDDSSASYIREWTVRLHSGHKVIQKGHPWLQYISKFSWPELAMYDKLVLITLQPIGDLIDDVVMEVMKATSKELKWFVRLHPRQLHLRGKLKELLSQNGLIPDVEVDLACDLPIPAIFSKASVHITRFSGSVTEAALMGVPNIIIDILGAEMYPDLIDRNQAVLFLGNDAVEFRKVIEQAVQQSKTGTRMTDHSWDFIVDLK